MAAILRGVGGLPFTALRLTMRLLRRLHRGPAPQHLLPVAGLDQERSAPLLFAIREAAREADVSVNIPAQTALSLHAARPEAEARDVAASCHSQRRCEADTSSHPKLKLHSSHVWNAGAGRAPEAGGVAAVCDARGQRAPNFVLASPSTRLRRRRCCTPSAGLRGAAGAILYAVCDTLTRSSCSGGWSAKSQATVGELVC